MSYLTENEVQDRKQSTLNLLDTSLETITHSAAHYERTIRRKNCSTTLQEPQLGFASCDSAAGKPINGAMNSEGGVVYET